MQRAIIRISKSKLLYNFSFLQAKYKLPLIAVIKDNAYGHGALIVAKNLEHKVLYLAVSSVEEALQLRQAEIKCPILVFGCAEEKDYLLAAKFNLTLSLNSREEIELYLHTNCYLPVHIKLNTGMNRLGLERSDWQFLKQNLTKINLAGIYTHFSCKEDNASETAMLIEAVNYLNVKTLVHTGESNNISSKTSAIRVGLGLYGLGDEDLRPILTLLAPIVNKRKIKKGESASYFKKYHVPADGYLYTLPIGYGDGWDCRREFIINNCETALPICMDYSIIYSKMDLPLQSYLTLIGKSAPMQDYSKNNNENIYQIATMLSKRLQRFQIK